MIFFLFCEILELYKFTRSFGDFKSNVVMAESPLVYRVIRPDTSYPTITSKLGIIKHEKQHVSST